MAVIRKNVLSFKCGNFAKRYPDHEANDLLREAEGLIADMESELEELRAASQPVGQEPVFPVAVTDAMVEAYVAAVDAHLGSLTPRDWEIERFDPAASIRRVAKIGLAAMLNALPRNGHTPLAVMRFEKKASGRENEMPRVISCKWLPDGDYAVYAAPPAQAVDVGQMPRGIRLVEIPRRNGLDPINVFVQDYKLGRGRIVVTCYGQAWCGFWGAMGDRTVMQFVAACDADYVAGNMLSGRHEHVKKHERAYVERIATEVIAEFRVLIDSQAVKS